MYHIFRFKTVESTNTLLKQMALEGALTHTVVVAESQTAGRGRMGRSFHSPKSGLYMSLLLHPFAIADPGRITTFTAVAVARALDRFGIRVGIKWVNDLMVNGRKLCGILAEAGTYDDRPFVVVGIGINLKKTDFPDEIANIAISAEHILGRAPDRDQLINAILEEIAKIRPVFPFNSDAIMAEYRRLSVTIGRTVTVIPHNGPPYEAYAKAILDDGSLLVIPPNSPPKAISSGEVQTRL